MVTHVPEKTHQAGSLGAGEQAAGVIPVPQQQAGANAPPEAAEHDQQDAQDGGADSHPPSISCYTSNEWRTPLAILSQLPSTVVDITFGVELPLSDDEIYDHLRSVTIWTEFQKHLLQLPALQNVRICLLKTISEVVAPVEWGKASKAYMASQMPALTERKLLTFEHPWTDAIVGMLHSPLPCRKSDTIVGNVDWI